MKQLQDKQKVSGKPYHEFLRVDTMSAGLYVLPAGAIDKQQPHVQDEVYYVVKGKGQFTVGGETLPVGPGDFIYVPKRKEHRFHSIQEELHLVVVFAPPEPPKA